MDVDRVILRENIWLIRNCEYCYDDRISFGKERSDVIKMAERLGAIIRERKIQ